jgi:mRNA interferase RelE/StbE
MAYTVEIKPSAARALYKLPQHAQDQIRPVIRALGDNPRPSGVVKMQGPGDFYRVRSGSYRIIYTIEDAALVVTVVRVADRSDVYKR